MIRQFVSTHPNARAYTSLGQLRYLSCIQHTDGVIGNSSSGLTEAPSLHKGTINIGDRQRGRLKAESVIDCAPDRMAIRASLRRLYSPEFQAMLPNVKNPYGEGGAGEKLVQILRDHSLDSLVKKTFHDLRPMPGPAT
jgi:GDP/UDP-N,N'-diacetylbacillosamine 2-epimerase (hydrolysing)